MRNFKKKILVTGGAGFIGSHLVDRLIKDGHRVVVVDNLSTGKRENLNTRAKFYNLDIQDKKISEIFRKEKPTTLFHYAAQISAKKSIEDPLGDAKINILGTLNLLENCRKYKVKKIIFASSAAVYGKTKIISAKECCLEKPLFPYGITKSVDEKYIEYYYENYGISFIVLRLSNAYGPRQNSEGEGGVIAIFCDRISSGKPPIIHADGCQTRDFIFVNDVVDANISALNKNKNGIFNISTGKENDINTIFRKLQKITNSGYKEKYDLRMISGPKRSCLNYAKAKKELGWQPRYSLDQGLKETVGWFKNKRLP